MGSNSHRIARRELLIYLLHDHLWLKYEQRVILLFAQSKKIPQNNQASSVAKLCNGHFIDKTRCANFCFINIHM